MATCKECKGRGSVNCPDCKGRGKKDIGGLLAGVLLVGCFILNSCAVLAPVTTAKVGYSLHARPVVAALENYRSEHSEYPLALTDLYPKYLTTNMPIAGGDWRISYERRSSTNYRLQWTGGLSYAVYETGNPVQYGSYVGH